MTFSDYSKHDGLGLAELVRKKKVSPGELMEEAISRIETHNPKINAVVQKLYDRARNAAKGKLPDGPFMGVPFLIKDLHATLEGLPTSNGNKLWKNVPATLTTEIVKRWEASGAIVVGRTNTPEFGLLPYTESDTLGPALNPWDVTRSPGGSSGGSGAAVAARITRAQQREGQIDSLALLDAERTFAETEADLAEMEGLVVTAQIDLFRALGGGWSQSA